MEGFVSKLAYATQNYTSEGDVCIVSNVIVAKLKKKHQLSRPCFLLPGN